MDNGNDRLRQAQEEVDEVKVIMLQNMDKANERSGKLEDLKSRAEELEEKSKGFEKTATKLKKKKRWENTKMKVVVGGILAAVLVVIVIVVTLMSLPSQDPDDRNTPVATAAANKT